MSDVKKKLEQAAQDVIDRWETPLWKNTEPTAHYIGRLRSALAAFKAEGEVASGWRPIEEAPDEELRPFLVWLPKYTPRGGSREVADPCVVQVERFEGNLYPSAFRDIVDWDDRITTATHFQPIPNSPKEQQ